ncbi:MAG: hypothetical protein ACI8RE_001623, partial [Ilumatobacter sp.]
ADPSGWSRKVKLRSRSSACATQYRASAPLAGPESRVNSSTF